jgi:hypothetical protein
MPNCQAKNMKTRLRKLQASKKESFKLPNKKAISFFKKSYNFFLKNYNFFRKNAIFLSFLYF